jgi:hypothetical protein
MNPSLPLAMIALIWLPVAAQNSAPVVTIQQASVDLVAQTVTLTFDLADAENDVCEVWLKASTLHQGYYAPVDAVHLTGAAGNGIMPGSGKTLTWQYTSYTTDVFDTRLQLCASDHKPVDVQSLVDQVDSVRLLQNLQFIEGVRHYQAGPAKLNAVRDSLQSYFQHCGLETEKQSFNYSTTQGYNIVGRKPGAKDEKTTWIVCGHYDGVAVSPAADDNGSAVTGYMEMLRIIAPCTFERSIRFIAFDFEEMGMVGSQRFVQNAIAPYDSIAGVLNFEMIGYYSSQPNTQSLPTGFNQLFPQQYTQVLADSSRGNFLLVCGNTVSAALTTQYVNAATQYVPALRIISLNVPGNGQTVPDLRRSDHAPFWDAGYKALMLTDGADTRNFHYHTPGDSIGTLSFTFMANNVKATLATLATLAVPISAGSDTFDLKVLALPEEQPCAPGNLGIAPNPAGPEITLQAEGLPAGELLVKIYDLTGAPVLIRQCTMPANAAGLTLDISCLPAGMYMIRCTSGQTLLAGKMVKM